MDKTELERTQREIAKLLGLKKYKKYPDGAMRVLLDEYGDDVAMAYSTGDWDLLKQPARGIYKTWEARGAQESDPGFTGVSERAAEQLGEDVTKRAAVFSEYLARRGVPAFSGPKNFRAKYLDEKLLSPQQARELLTSPVAAHYPDMVFTRWNIPVIGHAYQVTKDRSDEKGTYSLVQMPLPSSKVASFKDRRPRPAGPWEMPAGREDARSNEKPKREFKAPTGDWKILPFPGEDGLTHRVLVWRGSLLGKLHDEVGRLIQHYPWEEQAAVWFVLTGETPQVAPLTWQARWSGHGVGEDAFGYGFITLKIEPWVDPKLVWKVYSDIQRGLRGERRNRRLDPKTLDLLRFVNERVRVADLSRSERRRLAPELVAAWDRKNPDKSYNGNTREFWKAYHRARRAVISPTYEWRGES